MKKHKIKWDNVIKLLIFLFCVGLILHDFYLVAIKFYSWTGIGFATFLLAIITASTIYSDFEDQIKSIPSYQPKHAKDTK